MFGPVRALYATRVHASLWLIASGVVVAAVFAATPFLIPEVADRYEVSKGLAGMISVAQVGAFAATTFLLPRLTTASPTMVRSAAAALFAANLISAFSGIFVVLVFARALAGIAAGALTWVAWVDAMRAPRSMSKLSATGPFTVLLGVPVIGLVSDLGGDRAVFGLLTLTTTVLLVTRPVVAEVGSRHVVSRSRSNRVLLGALAMLTFFGASLFVYQAVVAGEELRISPFVTTAGFSLNAGGGIVGARLAARHRRPGWWLATCGPAALLSASQGEIGYLVGMTWWGFAFWMGVPGVLRMLAERSLEPSERAGDAQGFMALGRTAAPLAGGAFVNQSAYLPLALFAGAGLTIAGLVVIGVHEGRDRLPATQPLPGPGEQPVPVEQWGGGRV
jgi:predicted MFS family arabinose efflux permease